MAKVLCVLGLVLLLTGCVQPAPNIRAAVLGASTLAQDTLPTTPRPAGSQAALPDFSHIFVIVLENREASQVLNATNMPYLNNLARRYASAGNYYGVSHPSLPNYLALTGGSTAGVTSDCTNCFVPGDSLAGQLQTAGRSWKAYMEGMPRPCYLGNASPYAQKHNPFIYYDAIRGNPALCGQIVPFTQFATDLQAQTLPDFVWITPDLCHDMHDCANQVGDAWLQTWVPQILASPAWQDRGALFITFDEGGSQAGCCQNAAGGKVLTLVVSPLVRQGFVSPVAYSHYSLLRTIEMAWGLPLLGEAGCPCTAPMADFFGAASGPAATTRP
jgi:phosphatidylinositol-3-phosphatase